MFLPVTPRGLLISPEGVDVGLDATDWRDNPLRENTPTARTG
jgi:hypothetical protein